ncbi:esterase/lipase family protein [Streptomyces botrytidirepellens]|uniref:Alpha/beta hydrolase n=1 Tax=Streptomyces botrytidirepellens TaxID=2486417 RepID=A0A3M8W9A9_9ACTN|nr:alpha/beta fold hydrolase [Streptomyces botrytidirepellens]RNG26484.1 alpha/beta hydrolase [Streptomyces botrytidirepellens]
MAGAEKLPIVYVRGFAGDTAGIDKVVADPFYGFNEGSTHIRIGPDDEPCFYQFESPLLRLHLDERYQILVDGGQDLYLASHDTIPPDTIWVHRFYDASATTWGTKPREFRLETAAQDLLKLIETIREKSGAPRVHLVAHSMGGLVCRCLIQKILPDLGRDPADVVGKLFTYGTPHGGITFDAGFGLLERLRDLTGINGAEIFGPERMYAYLTPSALRAPDGPPDDWDPRAMAPDQPFAFPRERVFCLVGTDPTDYDVAHGLSAAAVGPRSDGLVQIDNAYVPGAHVAYVHRSHSGRYGLVNSEEGYQNLRRFLFGDRRVEAALVGHRLSRASDTTWQAEVRLSVRGLQIVTHERMSAHWCSIQLPAGGADGDGQVPLVESFLCSTLRSGESGTLRYALHLRILSLRRRDGLLSFRDHLEQTADFDDILVVDVGADATAAVPALSATWNSDITGPIRDFRPPGAGGPSDEDPADDVWVNHIELPATTVPILGEGARIRLTVTPWE